MSSRPRNSLVTSPRSGRAVDRRRPGIGPAAGRVLGELAGGGLAQLPIRLRFWDGTVLDPTPGHSGQAGTPPPVVVVGDRRAVSHVLHTPSQLGLARAWVDGSLWVEGDLERVLDTRALLNGVHLSRADRIRLALAAARLTGPGVLKRPPIPAIEASLNGERHSVPRDREAVRHHYDLSNDFYRLILGPTMVYSCAYFADPADTLEEAQTRKLDLICRKLQLAEGERLLDIGCGWGSLILHAVANYNVHAVGVTLSEPQAELARARAREQGLDDRIEIRVADYRELSDGPFHKIASVGMYEHVGRSELDEYVRQARRLLRPGGLFLNHGIVRLDSEPPTSDTFISRYIFPDGELHPVTEVMAAMRAAGLEVRDVESLREHYPLTLRRWLANLRANRDEALAMVGPERERTWQLYMLASAQGFESGEISVYQVLATRHDGPHRLPLDRSELLPGGGAPPGSRYEGAGAPPGGRSEGAGAPPGGRSEGAGARPGGRSDALSDQP
jgi:cyclopropane-fatty-acyl-phospholipid synthase